MRAALHGIDPSILLQRAVARGACSSIPPDGPLFVVAAGKAAAPMATAFVRLAPRPIVAGIGSGPGRPRELPDTWRWLSGGHPDPSPASVEAGWAALELAGNAAEERGTLVVLLSGGASAMLAAPAAGVSLEDQTATARALMQAGVAIDGLNCVRKHLSAVKGGWLAATAGRSLTLAISDVHGPVPDDPSVIGSGVTVPDPTTYADALAVIAGSGAVVPEAVLRRLERGAAGAIEDTPKPGDARLGHAVYQLVGSRGDAVAAARADAEALGYAVAAITPATAGESREAAVAFVQEALRLAGPRRPACVIASGETTVRVRGKGRGGRNQEFALAALAALEQSGERAVLVSVGTDGVDGPTDAAGGIVDAETAVRARRAGLDVGRALADNDAYPMLQALDGLVVTGPTGTNVGDLHLLLLG